MPNWTEDDLANLMARLDKHTELVLKPKQGKARGQHTSGVPNKTEQRFIDEYLQPRKLAGEIAEYKFEAITLKIAFDTRFTPDFFVLHMGPHSALSFFVEIKSMRKGRMFSEDDSKVKIKVAASQFSWWPFYWAYRLENGEWELERVKV